MKKIFIVLAIVLCSYTGVSFGQDMKIGVAAMGPETTAQISEVAGRAPYFLFFDSHANLLEAMENPALGASGGAGRDTADLLNKKKVSVFVAGRVGTKMKNALNYYKIDIQEQTGVANEVVQSIINNKQ